MRQLTANEAFERYFEVMREYPQLFEPLPERRGSSFITDRDALVRAWEELRRKAGNAGVPEHFYMLGVLCEDIWHMAIRDLVRFCDGRERPCFRFVRKKDVSTVCRSIVVVPYRDGMVLLTRRFRCDLGRRVWETPRGAVDPGMGAMKDGQRVLFVETGLTASKIRPLFHCHENNAGVVLAEVDGGGMKSDGEARWLTLPELERWILDGIVTDAALLAMYIYLQKMPKLQPSRSTMC